MPDTFPGSGALSACQHDTGHHRADPYPPRRRQGQSSRSRSNDRHRRDTQSYPFREDKHDGDHYGGRRRDGMCTLNASLANLYKTGQISYETALEYATDRGEMEKKLLSGI